MITQKKLGYLFLIFIFYGSSFAQVRNQVGPDSQEIIALKNKLRTAKGEREKSNILKDIVNQYTSKNLDSAIVYSHKIVESSVLLGDKDLEGSAEAIMSMIYLQNADFENFKVYYEKAKKSLEISKNYNYIALLNQITAYKNLFEKNNDEALKYFKKNITLYKEGKKIDKNLVLNAYQGIYSNNYVQNKFGEGLTSVNEYIDFIRKNYPSHLSQAYTALAGFYATAKDYKKAVEYGKKSIEAIDPRNKDLIFFNSIFVGEAYSDLGDLDSAKKHIDLAHNHFKKNNSSYLSDIYYVYAKIYEKEKNYILAEEYIQKAIKLAPEKDIISTKIILQTRESTIQVKKLLSDTSPEPLTESRKHALENLLKKLETEENFIKNTNTIIVPEVVESINKNLYQVHEQLGNYKEALYYYKKYSTENEKIFGIENMRNLSETQANFEIAQERMRVRLEEEKKQLQHQKELELKELRFQFEKKQEAAKTEEEKKRLALQEEMRRREIELGFQQRQKELDQKYLQERQFAKVNQEKKDAIAKAEIESSKLQKNLWAIGTGLSLLLLGFAAFSYYQKKKDNQKIAVEKKKSDDLLLNILPYEVAEELKETGNSAAKNYNEVSVLFTDFVNFTSNSEKIGVQEVLHELNICFTEFDKIMEKYNLEKIKTIGDAYLAVSGLPITNPDHAKNAVSAGLEILNYISERRKNHPNALEIRIGIHSGPVIAGIVGVKKFAFDIWGDTVNTASRMEQKSEKGRLNISETTYEFVKNEFQCEYRGKIETKGKGFLDMYFVNETIKS